MRWPSGLTIAAAALLGGRFCAGDGEEQLSPQDASPGNCPSACQALSNLLHDQVSFPNSSIYQQEEASYFSAQQSTVSPLCRVTPLTAKDASTTIIAIRKYKCPFAVKSGGHAPFAGASNVQGGITIDLSALKSIKVSSDKKTTEVGAGNRWGEVYSVLDQIGLSVVGGRVAGIGVGGLTLGGGVSFFSGRNGFACDNVRNYQVIFADGSINNVNPNSFPDLFWALRGGGNNFGLVTRFDLATFPQGPMWGGVKLYSFDKAPQIMSGFLDFVQRAPTNPDASLINIAGYNKPAGIFYMLEAMENAKPEAEPDIFSAFRPIETLSSTMRITNLSNIVHELEGVGALGLRQSVWTFTTRASGPLINTILSSWQTEIGPLKDTVSSFNPIMAFQSFTKNMVLNSPHLFGPNTFNLDPAKAPYVFYAVTMEWSDPSDDGRVLAAAKRIVDNGVAESNRLGLSEKYLYMNYAWIDQNVFAGYGGSNVDRLVKVHKKYDSAGVFTVLQPGYFKLPN